MAGGINWDALEAIQSQQERAFYRLNDLSSTYVPGELWPEGGSRLTRKPSVMLIGEAPGAQEDTAKRPFVGDAGIMLRRLMDMYLVGHPDSWITNTIKFRPARNRTPISAECELAKPYLIKEWHAVGCPRIIVCLGSVALMTVTGRGGIVKRSGAMEVWPASDGFPCYVWPMLHPSFGIRNPAMRKPIENDWDHLREWLRVGNR